MIFTWLCFRNVPAATSTSSSAICVNNRYGAIPISRTTRIGITQPHGDPIGVEVSGSEHQIPSHSED